MSEEETKAGKEIYLKVQEADPSHVARSIITLDMKSKQALGVTSGDIVEIFGTKKTGAIVWPARAEDEDKGIIQMDSLIRHNSGVGIGDKVAVRKAVFKDAKKVVLAPMEQVRIIASGYERILKRDFIGRPVSKGDQVLIRVFGTGFVYVVVETNPKGILKVNDFTQFELKEEPVKEAIEGLPRVAYEDIGGLRNQVQKVREIIELPMKHPELFRKLGIQPPKGVLLHGPPGTGKTMLAKAVASETNAHFISINGPEIMSKYVGEAEERLRQIFKEAEENSPSIIFIDEIDAIAPKRSEVVGEVERRVVAQLLALMDGLEARGNVIVISATNRVNAIDEALRRPGRFDREIEIGVPDKRGRMEILQIHTRGMPLAQDVNIENYAAITHGFVGADLAALGKEAAMKALRRYLPKINLEEEIIPPEILEALEVNKSDFDSALKEVQPSALREVLVEVPNIKWEDIGDLDEAKTELKEAVEWPLKNPKIFKKMGITPPKGILLYGPSGCGKTLLAKAVANESEANFISVKGPELLSMWVGESLPFDERILVFDSKSIFLEKIGKIVEEKKRCKVVSFDLDGKVIFSDILDHIKHGINGKMLEIKTKKGRKIMVTDKHSVFSLGENGIESVVPSQLVEGKSVIAIPSRIPNIEIDSAYLDLFAAFREKDGFVIRGVSAELKQSISILGKTKALEILKVSEKYLSDIINKNISVDLKRFSRLIDAANLDLAPDDKYIGVHGARNRLPIKMPFSEDLLLLAGLWVAEGDFNSNVVRIHMCDPEIREKASNALSSLSLPFSVFETMFVINSCILKRVFTDILGLETGAYNKRLPKQFLTLSVSKLNALLKGYFSGDGSVYGNSHRFVVEAVTVSKELANDLLYALLKVGIVASCREKREWNGTKSFRILFMGVDNFRKFSSIGFIDKGRNCLIGRYISEKMFERSNLIPMTNKIKNVLNIAFGSYPNNSSVGLNKLKQALQLVDISKKQYAELWRLAESDIYWDVVQEIKEVPYSGFVYDISVEPCQNFVAGFGGFFAHNSEKGVRKIFQKARQVSPVIVFFDEVDSIATHRGLETGSQVTQRVVDTLLTELDGMTDLKDVVFIAATNRPDILDPALLRPGRIDKIVLVGAPTEEGRLAVLKIHTRDVPLAKDVKIEELAEMTEGYSGADLDGLVREAVLIAIKESNLKPTEARKRHFTEAMKKVLPSISPEVAKAYAQFREQVTTYKPSYVG